MSNNEQRTTNTVPLWRNLDYVLLRGGQAISSAGSEVSALAFPLLVLALTGSPAQAALVGFCNTIPNFLFMLPAGALVDRWNRKRTMILCDTGRAIALGSIAVASWLGHLSLAQLALAAFVEGTLAVVFALAERVAVVHVVAREQLTDAASQNEALSAGAQMVGPTLGGLLFGVSRLLPFIADAVSYVVSVGSLLFIRAEFQEERERRQSNLWTEIAEGLRWLWNHPFLRTTAVLVAGANMLFQANFLILIVRAQQLHAGPAAIGLIFTLGGVGGLAGSLATPWISRRVSLPRVVITVNWIWALLWPLYSLIPQPVVFGIVLGVMSLVGVTWNIMLLTWALVTIPDELQGRTRAAVRLLGRGAVPLGSALSGVLLETAGAAHAILILAGGMVIIAVIATASRAIRSPQTPPSLVPEDGSRQPASLPEGSE